MAREDFDIRPAGPLDLDDLIVLLQELFSLEEDFTADPERQRRGLSLMLDGSSDRRVFVAVVDGSVAGMSTVQVVISTAEGGPVGLVEDVVVARRHRGRGLGRRLLAALEGWSHDRGLARLQLLADRENAPALAFYERIGWKPTQLVGLRKEWPI